MKTPFCLPTVTFIVPCCLLLLILAQHSYSTTSIYSDYPITFFPCYTGTRLPHPISSLHIIALFTQQSFTSSSPSNLFLSFACYLFVPFLEHSTKSYILKITWFFVPYSLFHSTTSCMSHPPKSLTQHPFLCMHNS